MDEFRGKESRVFGRNSVRNYCGPQELASHLTVSRETVSNYENGKSPELVNVIAEIAQVLDAELVIGGCKITKADMKRTPDAAGAEQLCFAYDTEHRYKTTILTIRPTRKSIIINAVVARTR